MKWNGNRGKCFFYRKMRHIKKDCAKYKKWLKKKGNHGLTFLKSNFIEAPSNTSWIDLGSKIYIAYYSRLSKPLKTSGK